MKKVDKESRTRKNVYLNDELYKQVSIKAIEKEVDKGKVIEEALKKYLSEE